MDFDFSSSPSAAMRSSSSASVMCASGFQVVVILVEPAGYEYLSLVLQCGNAGGQLVKFCYFPKRSNGSE